MSKRKFFSLLGLAVFVGLALQVGLIIGLNHFRALAVCKVNRLDNYPQGAAIPNGPEVSSDKEFCRIYRSWFQKIAVAESEKSAGSKKEVSAFLEHGIESSKGVNIQTEQKFAAEAAALDKSGIKDPVFQLFAGIVTDDPATKQKFLSESLNGLEQSSYPRFLAFMAAANLSRSLSQQKAKAEVINAADDAALRYLEQGLTPAAIHEEEMPALRWRLSIGSSSSLMERRGADFVAVVERSPAVAPWLKHYLAGRHFIREAWKARGDGWSNTVTEEGWHGFSKNLAFARESLTRSWELNPKDPAAAASMIEVAMGDGGGKTDMRRWFDRAVAAQMDFPEAYEKFRWGLRPRWHGSHAEMLAFGRECIATKRYDTCVPYHYVNIVIEVASEEKNSSAFYKQHDVIDPARKTLDAYLKSENPPFSTSYGHTLAAILAYKAGDLRAAREEMKNLRFQPDPARELSEMENLKEMLRQLRSVTPSDEVQRVSL